MYEFADELIFIHEHASEQLHLTTSMAIVPPLQAEALAALVS
jgi:hypothetical protein